LAIQLQQVLFTSTTGEEAYAKLQGMSQDVLSYWLGIDRLAIDKYIQYATLPFTLRYISESAIYPQVQQTLNKIISSDMTNLRKFETGTLHKISSILYAIASADDVSLRKLGDNFGIAIDTLVDIFNTCAKAELQIRVYPYGARYAQVKKPSKYLFTSSAYRSMFFHIVGSQAPYEKYKGALLEYIVGLYLSRLFSASNGIATTYDSSEGSADFILTMQNKTIPIEIDFGTKGYRQLAKTMQHIKSNYGLVISAAQQLR
jgi:predicted AAA+ superfamily ATPase